MLRIEAIEINRFTPVGGPYHLVRSILDVLPLKEVYPVLVPGKVNDLVILCSQRACDREEHRVAKAATRKQHEEMGFGEGWSAALDQLVELAESL